MMTYPNPPSRGLQPARSRHCANRSPRDTLHRLEPAPSSANRTGARPHRWLRLLAAVVPLACSTVALAQQNDPLNPPQGLFADDWLEVYFGGGKIGYGHSTMRREGDLIHTRVVMKMQLRRANQTVKMAISSGTTETVAGRPVSFMSELDMSIFRTIMRGEISGGEVRITQSQPKIQLEKKMSFPFPKGAMMTWGAFREGVIHGYKPGVQYTLKIYTPDMRLDDALETQMSVGDWETKEVLGKAIRGMRVTSLTSTGGGEIEMLAWVNEAGDVLVAEISMPGVGSMQLLAVDQETAMADFFPAEIFMTTTISVPPIDTAKVRAIRFKISLAGEGYEVLDLPTTGMQTPRKIDDRSSEVLVQRQVHRSSGHKTVTDAAELAPYLQSNLMINTDDPALRKIADRAAGDATDPFVLADNLRRFVRAYISEKSLDVGFASASEVCRSRKGDCSEHGVLLAALGRIKKLPSRLVVGVAYVDSFGGQEHILGYHMWTQFFIDGQWYDFDAALGDEVAPHPGRIALAITSLRDSSLADISIPLLSKIGNLKVEILDTK